MNTDPPQKKIRVYLCPSVVNHYPLFSQNDQPSFESGEPNERIEPTL
jgi:hypothetical protein